MTLHPGDLLLLGVAQGAPLARAGQRVRVEGAGLGAIEFAVEAAAQGTA
jgi:2-keto-4-pentenoate hydratase/2-oxohepta-3-ene-1,7-dioic acid hydratase in catechol pathway